MDTKGFIERVKKIHGDKYDLSKVEYKGYRNKVCIISHELDKNGNEFGEHWIYPGHLLNGQGNPHLSRGKKEECWEERICPICGKPFTVRKKVSKICCSEECRKKYVELHKDEINKKRSDSLKKTNSKKTKEDFANEREKRLKTMISKYGCEYFSQTDAGRKLASMNMKKMKSDYDKKYVDEVLIPKYKEICENDGLELIEFRSRFDCTVKCKKCGNTFVTKTLGYLTDSTTTNRCKICHPYEPILGPTKIEDEFELFLKRLGVKYLKNTRTIIYPKEIDFYLPDYKIGFEMDGLYWHCETQKDDDYHLNKTIDCEKKEVKLIHIFEDEWCDKQMICESRVKNMLNMCDNSVGARKCEIRKVETGDERDFLNKNHIQGYTPSKIAYGLFYEGRMVSIMTFSGLRKNLGSKQCDGEYELLRFCNEIGLSIPGAASKLLKHFINEVSPTRIISYADKRWSNGNVYEKLGFCHIRDSKPNYFYLVSGKRLNRFGFRKSELIKKYGCPEEMTEHEFCLSQRWYRLYDCGTKVYEMVIKKEDSN